MVGHLYRENQRLKRLLNESKKENINLVSKLSTARRLLDQKRHQAEEDRNKVEKQLQMARDLLFADDRNHIHDETKEKLQFLNSSIRSRISNEYNDRLSAIQDLDSTGFMLSDLSYSRSDDDLDLDALVHKKRTYKKQRQSAPYEEPPSVKRRRSHVVELNSNDGAPERMVATTTVPMEEHDAKMPSAPEQCGSRESVESGLSIEINNSLYCNVTLRKVGVLPIIGYKIDMRNHTFASKTMKIRFKDCDVCEERITFGNTILRCRNCRASCHPRCKEDLPLPCIAPGKAPSKKNMGVIADYTPATPPMVPALIVHCLNEIEARGLDEHGIYRVPGSDKEVKALKDKFMKFRRVPRLADIHIHVICGCMKDFLRTLKEPLVTHALWWQFARAAEILDIDERRANLYQAISQLPQPNRETLAFVILHILRVAEASETNEMPISNLTTVFGPTVVGYALDYDPSEAYTQTDKAKLVLEQLLDIPSEYWYRVIST